MLRGKSWDNGWLTAYWGKEGRGSSEDILFAGPCKPDAHLLYWAISSIDMGSGKTLVEELEARGYDITTLQFSVKRKWKPNEKPV